MLYTNPVKRIWLLAFGFWLLAVCYSRVDAVTPTPITNGVGVKLKVQGPSPTIFKADGTSTPSSIQSTQEASGAGNQQVSEIKISGTPGQQSQQNEKEPLNFVQETVKQLDEVLARDNQWLLILASIWIIFIFVMLFLFLRHKRKKKIEFQNLKTLNQATTGGAAPAAGAGTTSGTSTSS